MSDQPTTNKQTDKTPPLPDLERDVDMKARVAEQLASSHIGRTVAQVERDLILDTLKHCLGNRTHAANILGISIRTLRNKLNEYMTEGYAVPSPASGVASSAA
jgi:two-component system, response regulator FlrC